MPRMRAPMCTLGPWLGARAAVPDGTTGQAVSSNRSRSFSRMKRPGGIEVAIALRVQAVDEEALPHDQTEAVLCVWLAPLSGPSLNVLMMD
jgi:hypothetical protein